jgi:hypothetical protein
VHADRIEQHGLQWCAVSEDGSRSLGCYDTEAEARERLRQVEAAVEATASAANRSDRGPELSEIVNVGSSNSDMLNSPRGDSVFRVDRLGPVHCDKARTDGVLAELTPEGFLRCEAMLTRIGVFDYEDAEGNSWGEFRDASEVFAGDSLDSFRMVVITDDHPADMVSAENVKDVQVGHVGSDVRRDGDHVRASLIITDKKIIRSIQDGKVELSCGYFAQVVQDDGVAPDGTPYTSRQTKIRGNHLALVEQGRAGPSCRLLLDSGDAITKQDIRMPKKKKSTEDKKDARVIVGGAEFDVPDEVAEALGEMTEKLEEQAAELARMKEPAAEEPAADMEEEAEIEIEADAEKPPEPAAADEGEEEEPMKTDAKTKAKQDAMQARIDSLEAKLEASDKTEDARIDARVSLVTTCRKVLGADFKTDSVSEIDLQKAIVVHCTPSMKAKLDGKSSDYVRAAYEMALDAESKRVDSSADLLEVTGSAIIDNAGGKDSDVETAHADMMQHFRDNYRQPAAKEIN